MRVVLSPRAEKQFRKLSKTDQIAVARKIRLLKKGSQTTRKEKLKGFRSIYRVRIGDYRIVYKKTIRELYIILISHRRDVYRLLRQLFS